MIRILYVLSLLALIAGTGWAAAGLKAERPQSGARIGLVLLVALQR